MAEAFDLSTCLLRRVALGGIAGMRRFEKHNTAAVGLCSSKKSMDTVTWRGQEIS